MEGRTEHEVKNATKRVFVFTRKLSGSRSRAFNAWTNPYELAKWWGPKGYTNPICELDARPGGYIRIHMRGPEGSIYPLSGVYHEIVPSERLVFLSAIPGDDDKPILEVLNSVVFVDQGREMHITNQVRVVSMTHAALPYLRGMDVGWNQTLERLDEYLRNS